MRKLYTLFTVLFALVLVFALATPALSQAVADSMLYEVVQVDPDIGATPPTADAGFGSTNGGILGWANVQRYIRADGNNGSDSIVGLWLSTGTNLAPLLVQLVKADTIWAEFKDDNTYLVTLIDQNGIVIPFTGTYTISASGYGNIFNITLNQSTPSTLTSKGIFEIFPVTTGVEENPAHPLRFELSQNYPNPFNPATTISFSLPMQTDVKLTVYNSIGQAVKVLVQGEQPAGVHHVTFDARKLPTGVYFYEIVAGKYRAIKKMLYLK